MLISAQSVIRHPRARVYRAYRDELPAIAEYMNNIKEIIVRERVERPAGVRFHNEWVGKTEIPRLVQSIVRPEMVRWDDYADWNDVTHSCDWNLKIRVFTDNFSCHGTNRLEEASPTSTRVVLHGTLEIQLKDLPGVPRLLARPIAVQVERFIVALIRPNLEQVNVSLGRYLDANP